MFADCINEQALQELAARTAPAGFLEEHGQHISMCNRCASLLKTYLLDFSDEVTPEEDAILNGLESSRPEGQRALLEKLFQHMKESQVEQDKN
jgi:hypothetical protein